MVMRGNRLIRLVKADLLIAYCFTYTFTFNPPNNFVSQRLLLSPFYI